MLGWMLAFYGYHIVHRRHWDKWKSCATHRNNRCKNIIQNKLKSVRRYLNKIYQQIQSSYMWNLIDELHNFHSAFTKQRLLHIWRWRLMVAVDFVERIFRFSRLDSDRITRTISTFSRFSLSDNQFWFFNFISHNTENPQFVFIECCTSVHNSNIIQTPGTAVGAIKNWNI